jgi:hypothetical protein
MFDNFNLGLEKGVRSNTYMGTVYKVPNSECLQVYNVLLLNIKIHGE